MTYPFSEPYPGEELKSECLDVPHVHCTLCEFVIPTVPDYKKAAREILIHVRDTHNEDWVRDPKIREIAPMYGVESL